MKFALIFASVFAIAVAPTVADVIDVGGPNPDAVDVTAALALASDGDVIRVYSGTYTGFTIDGKSVSVVAATPQSDVVVNGGIVVLNLAAGGEVELEGMNGGAATATGSASLFVGLCQGSVRITDCHFRQYSPAGRIESSSDVAMTSCALRGQSNFYASFVGKGGDGLQVSNSNVALYRTTAQGGDGGDVDIIDCNLAAPDADDGGDGIKLEGSGSLYLSLCILGAGSGGTTPCSVGSSGVNGICVRASGSANYDVRLQQTATCSMSLGASTLMVKPDSTRRLSSPAWVYDTDLLEVTLHGKPGEHLGLFFGTAYDHVVQPTNGPLLVDVSNGFNTPIWRYLGTMGASGSMAIPIPLRDLPPFAHVKLHLVGVGVSDTGRFFTNSVSPLILDTAW